MFLPTSLLAATALLVHTAPVRNFRLMPRMMDLSIATEEDKALFALGHKLGSKVPPRTLSQDEVETLMEGFRANIAGTPSAVDLSTYVPRAIALLQDRELIMAKRAIFQGDEALAVAEEEPGAVRTRGGAVLLTTLAATGSKPNPYDTVRVHYEGRLIDGTIFDSSYDRGEPMEFPLDRVIQGWTEGLQLMTVGSKARLTVPAALGYGDQGVPPDIPGRATLIFDIELLSIKTSDCWT
mmetsp:Transcript_36739/g.97075  ORF Transcript_36739/g.97075 Transcript_36739/m.97075 type:complete len:238 (+) Transcript_36739:21-734(+)|eukprot:CAMPEP_0115848368 /NCGR_PEP_ID=MMETSP0287-20121206/10886_1 /TAXON_ID=412157 /ORGANISM="Chrysochromulina rotalis, Strain UIO044" /LENGTH=237 /DNA_ID=CAMNT_0003302279 /DNA_START=21 /DNA_END=734 /DNA_ORIENTATION=-